MSESKEVFRFKWKPQLDKDGKIIITEEMTKKLAKFLKKLVDSDDKIDTNGSNDSSGATS